MSENTQIGVKKTTREALRNFIKYKGQTWDEILNDLMNTKVQLLQAGPLARDNQQAEGNHSAVKAEGS